MKENINNTNSTDTILTRIEDNILLVGLNRPEKRNALYDKLIMGLESIFTNIPDHVRCAIIYGEGAHFSAGLDLSELKESELVEVIELSRLWHRAMDKIQFGKVPVIAVLHGAVVGGGLELAGSAHIRVAESSTFYALPEGQRGIYVGGGASVRIPKLIGEARMQDMMFTGRVYDAQEGYNIGLSQYLTGDGKGLEKAKELALKIASNTDMTNYALMHVLPRINDASREHGLMLESLMAAISQNTPEAKDRLHKFLDGKAQKVKQL